MKLEYTIEVHAHASGYISYWVVNAGVGWVLYAQGLTLQAALAHAAQKAQEQGATLVPHPLYEEINVRFGTGRGVRNGRKATDAASREAAYREILADTPADLRAVVDRTIREVWPVK